MGVGRDLLCRGAWYVACVALFFCVRVGCVCLCGLCVIDFAMLKRLLLSG